MSPIERGHGRLKNIIATVAVTTVAVAGAALGTVVTQDSGGGSEVTANLWVDSTGGTCADSASEVSYPGNGSECATLASAVAAAEPGDKIAVRAGVYAFETLPYQANLDNLSPGCDPYGEWGDTSTANCVHIVPDGDVTIRGMSIGASSLWLEGNMDGDIGSGSVSDFNNRSFDFHITNSDLIGNPPAGADDDAACNCKSATFQIKPTDATSTAQRPDHIILDKLDVDTMSAFSADNVEWKDLDIGPLWIDTSARGSASGSGPLIPTFRATGDAGPVAYAVVRDTFIHEINRTWWCDLGNVCHPDGLYIIGGGPYTISGMGMSQISGEVLFFENPGDVTPNVHDVLVENSWAGCKVGSYPDNPATARTSCGSSSTPVDIKNCGNTTGCTNMLFRYNAFYAFSGAETQYTNVRWVGNATKQNQDASCTSAGVTFDRNAFYVRGGSGNCGSNAVSTGSTSPTSLFTNVTPGSEDFHLAGADGSTVADDLVDVSTADYALNEDMDGETRPADTNRDAGADER